MDAARHRSHRLLALWGALAGAAIGLAWVGPGATRGPGTERVAPGPAASPGSAADSGRGHGPADLALSVQSRYLRHPAQADDAAWRGDFPGAIERAPAGSVLRVRPRWRRGGGRP